MFREFFRFELRYQLHSPLPWVVGLVFALLAFAATTSEIITIGEGIGNANRNAPYVILTFLDVFTTLGMFVAVALIAQPLLRDFELGTEELFFSKPLNKATYLWGRFAAGSFMALIVMIITALGMMHRRVHAVDRSRSVSGHSRWRHICGASASSSFRTCCSPARCVGPARGDDAPAAAGVYRRRARSWRYGRSRARSPK